MRLLRMALALPALLLLLAGVAGGWLVGTGTLDFSGPLYIRSTLDYLEPWDVLSGLIKAAVFGLLVALMGCYHGYHSQGGARGVGTATTNAVVSAAILVFAANVLLTALFTA